VFWGDKDQRSKYMTIGVLGRQRSKEQYMTIGLNPPEFEK